MHFINAAAEDDDDHNDDYDGVRNDVELQGSSSWGAQSEAEAEAESDR